eukprot:COSAG06_NODE_50788_length_316_cov_0.728111_1_plen_50_part_01
MSTLALSIQLAAKRSGWHWKNGQKLKTGQPFKSSPHNAFLLPPNATRGTP